MRYFIISILLLLFLSAQDINAQRFIPRGVNTISYPELSAGFMLFDQDDKIMSNLSASDFRVTEDGTERQITGVHCIIDTIKSEANPVSIALTFDISGSMASGAPNIYLAQTAGYALIKALRGKQFQCAVTGFDHDAILYSGLTADTELLTKAIGMMKPRGGTDYQKAFMDPVAGGLNVVSPGKYDKIMLMLTDGLPTEPVNESEIIAKAKQDGTKVYAVLIDMEAPASLKNITAATGGACFENINSIDEAVGIYLYILFYNTMEQERKFCAIEWLSDGCEQSRQAEIEYKPFGLTKSFYYNVPEELLPGISATPEAFNLKDVGIDSSFTQTVTLQANNFTVTVDSIVAQGYGVQVTSYNGQSPPFELTPSESKELTLGFDLNGLNSAKTKFTVYAGPCGTFSFWANASVRGKIPNIPDYEENRPPLIKINHPDGGEIFAAGADTSILIDNIPPGDSLTLEYTLDAGAIWTMITDSAHSRKTHWQIPDTSSYQCLIRARQIYEGGGANEADTMGRGAFVAMDLNSDNSRLIVLDGSNEVSVIDMNDYSTVQSFHFPYDDVRQIVCSNTNPDILALRSPAYIYIVNLSNTEDIYKIDHNQDFVRWSPDDQYFAIADRDIMYVINSASGELIQTFEEHSPNNIKGIEWAPDGRRLISFGTDNNLFVWDLNTGNPVHTINDGIEINDIIYSASGDRFARSADGTITIYNSTSFNVVQEIESAGQPAFAYFNGNEMDLATNEMKLMKIGNDYRMMPIGLNIINLQISGEQFSTLFNHRLSNASDKYKAHTIIAFAHGLGKLAMQNENNRQLQILDQDSKSIVYSTDDFGSQIYSLSWLPGRDTLIVSTTETGIQYWDLKTKTKYMQIWDDSPGSYDIKPSYDCKYLMAKKNNSNFMLFDNSTGNLIFGGLEGCYDDRWEWKPDANILAYCDNTNNLITANMPDNTKLSTIRLSAMPVDICWFHSRNKIAGLVTDSVFIYDIDNSTIEYYYVHHNPMGMNVTADDKLIFIAQAYDMLIFDIDTKTFSKVDFDTKCSYTLWSADDQYLVSASPTELSIFSTRSGEVKTSGFSINTWGLRSSRLHSNGRIVANGHNNLIQLFYLNDFPIDIQSDISDSLFAIIRPEAQSFSIDMGTVYLGDSRDSIVRGFISNSSGLPIRIDSIYIEGPQQGHFSIMSGMPPYTIQPGASRSVEFSYCPTAQGSSAATIHIITQSLPLQVAITGTCIESQYELSGNIIDFGEVNILDKKSLNEMVALNSGNRDVTIAGYNLMSVSDNTFNIDFPAPGSLLAQGSDHRLQMEFAPRSAGQFSAVLEIQFEDCPYIVTTTLTGRGIGLPGSMSMEIGNYSAKPGDTIGVEIELEDLGNMQQTGAYRLEYTLSYDPEILYPLNYYESPLINEGRLVCSVPLDPGHALPIELRHFIVMLGEVSESDLNISNPIAIGGDVEISTTNGNFELLYCKAGGDRLFSDKAPVSVGLMYPNPANEYANLQISAPGPATISLGISDIYGNILSSSGINLPHSGAYELLVNTRSLPTGQYLLRISTGTGFEIRNFVVLR